MNLFPLDAFNAAVLSGVLISLLAPLIMIAVYNIAKDQWEASGAMQAVFYLLIWPVSMFLAQVNNQGLFI